MKCLYEKCRKETDMSWRLVPVCDVHHEKIRFETYRYYADRITAKERVHYLKIKGLIRNVR